MRAEEADAKAVALAAKEGRPPPPKRRWPGWRYGVVLASLPKVGKRLPDKRASQTDGGLHHEQERGAGDEA